MPQEGRRRQTIDEKLARALSCELRFYNHEQCICVTLADGEVKIRFSDIYGVEVVEEEGHAILHIYTFASERYHPKNCCGCTKA